MPRVVLYVVIATVRARACGKSTITRTGGIYYVFLIDINYCLCYKLVMYTATSMLGKARSNAIYGPITDNRKQRYRIYLNSEHWKNLRQEKLEKNPRCEKCGRSTCLDVHHLVYRDLYDVTLKDLQTLCRSCHNKEHEKKNCKSKKQVFRKRINRKERGYENYLWSIFHNRKPNVYLIQWLLKEILWMCAFYSVELEDGYRTVPPKHLSKRNQEKQRNFDKKYKEIPHYMNNYISIHY